jgi:hypothetical protein
VKSSRPSTAVMKISARRAWGHQKTMEEKEAGLQAGVIRMPWFSLGACGRAALRKRVRA